MTSLHPALLALSLCVSSTGCSSNAPSVEVAKPAEDDAKAVPPPKELVGKWKLEVKDGNSTKTTLYHFQKDGRIEIETVIKTGDKELKDTVKSAITKAEGGKLTLEDLSRTGSDGIENFFPPERRRPRTVPFRIDGEKLTWGPRDDQPKAPAWELKRVKE